MRSIGNAVEQIEEITREFSVDVMCVSEHWKTKEQLSNYGVENFVLASSFCRGLNEHGGTAIYCHKSVKWRVLGRLENWSIPRIFECSAIEVQHGRLTVNVICLYRPPSVELTSFLERLEQVIIHLSRSNGIVVIAGDLNINTMNESSNVTQQFLQLINS